MSQYTDTQKRKSIARARALLERLDATDVARDTYSPVLEHQPELERSTEQNDRVYRYGLSLAVTDPNGEHFRAEAETFQRECELEREARRERERQIIRQAAEMSELSPRVRDTLAMLIAGLRQERRADIAKAIDTLRAELGKQRSVDGGDPVIRKVRINAA